MPGHLKPGIVRVRTKLLPINLEKHDESHVGLVIKICSTKELFFVNYFDFFANELN